MEQCEDMQQFRYGNKAKTLWSTTSRQECEGSLAAMRTVVEDVLARLNVDFHVNDLYMIFHCMNLDEWHEAFNPCRFAGFAFEFQAFCPAQGGTSPLSWIESTGGQRSGLVGGNYSGAEAPHGHPPANAAA
jgi:hypothetical protein